ncbi:rCG28643 [Rattus norvegicus]|uniref:RCG28643 n=1 Tax=Rattus norvegicus TaxID=10116 RepID=A6HVC9_RAT|nr:rCG28643 [Rattus norvegicus]
MEGLKRHRISSKSCSCRGPELCSQHLQGGSKITCNSSLRGPDAFL